MTDTRPICVRCQHSMKCIKNGVIVKYSEHERQQGDLYECEVCGNQIIVGFGSKYYDPNGKYAYTRNTQGKHKYE